MLVAVIRLMHAFVPGSVRLLEDALRWWSADLFSPEELARDKAASETLVRGHCQEIEHVQIALASEALVRGQYQEPQHVDIALGRSVAATISLVGRCDLASFETLKAYLPPLFIICPNGLDHHSYVSVVPLQAATANGVTPAAEAKPVAAMNGPTAAVPKHEPSDAALGAASAHGVGSADGPTAEAPAEPVYSPAALDRLIHLANTGDVPIVRPAHPRCLRATSYPRVPACRACLQCDSGQQHGKSLHRLLRLLRTLRAAACDL